MELLQLVLPFDFLIDNGRDDEKQSNIQIYRIPAVIRFQRNRRKLYFIEQLRNCIYKNINRQSVSVSDIYLFQTESAVLEEQTSFPKPYHIRRGNGCKLDVSI